MSLLVKHLLNERRMLFRRDGSSMAIQTLIKKINALIRRNQLLTVKNDINNKDKGSKSWWSIVNSITGRESTRVSISSIVSPDEINDYFCTINTDPNYFDPEILSIPDGTTSLTICNFLLNLKRTTAGPDQLPFWLWRDFAFDLAPIISHILNCSLTCQTVPTLWKMADIMPLPKESPFRTCNQLRPISLTNVIMTLFERVVFRFELSNVIYNSNCSDQFAYHKGPNTTMALVKCQHEWLRWLDSDADFIRIFSFDFSKAFDSVPHDIVCRKLRNLEINPCIYNWIVNFLKSRQQRVVVDGISTSYLSINRDIPQGTVIGPILFSIMVNDIKAVNPSSSLLVKYADDISLSIPVGTKLSQADSKIEVKSIMEWAKNNHTSLNLGKTWEMLMKGKTEKDQPDPLQYIKCKSNLKLLGVTFEDNPTNWDTHFDHMLSKASSHLYMLRVCKHYEFLVDYLDLLFKSLILSIFTYAIEVWGGAFYNKYLSCIDKFFNRVFKLGYTKECFSVLNILPEEDRQLWEKIKSPNNPLHHLLPPTRERVLRNRGHSFIIPRIRTERFKSIFINRNLLNLR